MEEQRARELVDREVERVERVISDVKGFVGDTSEKEELAEFSSNDQHPADLGTETFERERDYSLLDSLEREMRDLESAMRRIDEGSYGLCEGCGAEIAGARLEAKPAARFCTEHEPER